jgi:hypothetical protein
MLEAEGEARPSTCASTAGNPSRPRGCTTPMAASPWKRSLGPHRVTPSLQQSRWRRFIAALVNGAVLFGFITLVPSEPYAPGCHPWRDAHVLRGPMREQFVLLLASAMQRERFRYWRFGAVVLVPSGPCSTPIRFSRTNLNSNSISLGRSPPASPMAWASRVATTRHPRRCCSCSGKPRRGTAPSPRRMPDGQRIHGPDLRFKDDCNLFRAAVLRVEEMRQPPCRSGKPAGAAEAIGRPGKPLPSRRRRVRPPRRRAPSPRRG